MGNYLTDITFDELDAARVGPSIPPIGPGLPPTITQGGSTTLIQVAASGRGVALTASTSPTVYNLIITGGTDVNVYDAAVADGGIPVTDVIALIVTVTGPVKHLIWDTRWQVGCTFTLANQSAIVGKGGTGGVQSIFGSTVNGSNGTDGGNAIDLSGQTVSINNGAGFIGGGGGGGASGGGVWNPIPGPNSYLAQSGSGGGGAGDGVAGNGGFGSTRTGIYSITQANTAGVSASGALISQTGGAAGLGCHVSPDTVVAGDGGIGGDYGAAGANGVTGSTAGSAVSIGVGGTGGAAGNAINLIGGTATFTSGNNPAQVKGAVS